MACDYTALSAYLDGELGDAKRRLVEAHINECSDCARELQSLERVRAMVTACAIPAGMHGRLMAQLGQEQHRGHVSGLRWLVTAVAVVLLAVGTYWMMRPPGDPDMPAIAPVLTKHEAPEPQNLAQLEAPRPIVSATTAPAPPVEEARFALQLQGTVKGTVPQAVILRTDIGRSATYGVGQEVLPGVRLAEVRDKEVVLADADGTQHILDMTNNPAPEAISIAGMWRGTLDQGGGASPERVAFDVTDESGKVTMRLKDESSEPALTGQRTGDRLVLAMEDESSRIQFQGVLDSSFNKITGHAMQVTADARMDWDVELTRVPEEDARELELRAKTDAAREAELKEMFAPLKAYADANGDKFPDSLSQLVPAQLADLARYANRPDRTVEYLPGATTKPWVVLDFDTFRPDTAMGERLVAYEQQLRLLWGSDIPVRAILKVTYPYPDENCKDTYSVSTTGATSKVTSCGNPTGTSQEERITVERAQSQNNLKQLMLIEKMFAAEHKGVTLPGWLTAYPEYLTDAGVCTAPWDEPGTDSYEILFPGASESELEALAAEIATRNPHFPDDPNDPAYSAKLQSCTPCIVEKRPDPRNPIGRNVAFLDGHVEFVRNEEWKTVVAPFMR